MGFENRDYASGNYDGRPGSGFWASPVGRALWWLGTGRVYIYTAFGIRVALHASMIVLWVSLLLFDWTQGFDWQDRVVTMALIFGIILLHEYGHCFAARGLGGQANEILMWPLGGLAFTDPPHRPLPVFLTVAAGPGVNVAICLVTIIALAFTLGDWTLSWVSLFNPLQFVLPFGVSVDYTDATFYLWYTFKLSYLLFLFNLLPIFPLDGGQMLQATLWPRVGYYRSMMFSLVAGQIGCVLLGIFGLLTWNLWLVLLGVMFFINNRQRHEMLKAEGPWAFSDQDEPDWMRSVNMDPDQPEKVGLLERRRQAKDERRAEAEAARVAAREAELDEILAKIGKSGRDSLSRREKRVLEEATEARRKARS